MIKIGLTGPTGAGKSTVAAVLAEHGMPIIDADAVAREITAPSSPVLDVLAETFGADILTPDHTLKRDVLAAKAFATPDTAKLLNSITHPAILELMQQQLDLFATEGVDAVIIDAPLLFEAGVDRLCDHTVAVVAPADARRDRIVQRDNLSVDAAAKRMQVQPHLNFYTDRAEVVLVNDGTLEQLLQKAAQLAEQIDRWCV